MRSSATISLLAATSALAAPFYEPNDVTITLSGDSELATSLTLQSAVRNMAVPSITGPFTSILVHVDASSQNQDLRCQALDQNGQAIIGNRGANRDITFSDGGKGAWTFDAATQVSTVICDPTFVKGNAADFPQPSAAAASASTATGSSTAAGQTLSVQLSTTSETAITRQLPADTQTSQSLDDSTGWQTVQLSAPAGSTERCKIVDTQGNDIIVTRGTNRDITFSDAGKGPWNLETPSAVSQIICDPAFVAQKV